VLALPSTLTATLVFLAASMAVVLQLLTIFTGNESGFTTTWFLASLVAFAWIGPTWWQWRHGWPRAMRRRGRALPRATSPYRWNRRCG
jgi:uncharacterized membrane protein YdjX (TVP38/TMEM64 family)